MGEGMRMMIIAIGLLTYSLTQESYAETPLHAQVAAHTEEVANQVRDWRRHIHAHPELSNREKKTAALVASTLKELGVDTIRTEVARHGVVGLIKGAHPGPTIALRADMDALPVTEATKLPYASQRAGVMHACGHDAHTAILLGAAAVLVQLRDQLHGQVVLLFQPAEEGAPPGERGGASEMIRQGALEQPKVSAIFGLHVFPDLPTGSLGYRAGGMMASVDRFKVTITGAQSHAAYPWKGIDPIVTASHVVTAAQTVVSRVVDAREPAVLSFGRIEGGQRWNIIPQSVTLEGTVRTHASAVREQVKTHFERIVSQTAAAHGASAVIDYTAMTPVLWNDKTLTPKALKVLEQAGPSEIVELAPSMGGEDFAFYAQKIPAFFFRLGVRNEAIGAVHGLHTPRFQLDEAALPLGVRALTLLALSQLGTDAR